MQCFLFINSKYFKHKCYYQRNKKKLLNFHLYTSFCLVSKIENNNNFLYKIQELLKLYIKKLIIFLNYFKK